MNDFIKIIDNAIPNELCDILIKHADEKFDNSSSVHIIKYNETQRQDEQLFLADTSIALNIEINNVLSDLVQLYINKYPVLSNIEFVSTDNKLQRTKIGGGFHEFHFEQANINTCRRCIVWSIYLNDVAEGGETEFLYQHKRIKAKKGTAVFFPACYTHTHRGNPPISNNKYILTGWYNLC